MARPIHTFGTRPDLRLSDVISEKHKPTAAQQALMEDSHKSNDEIERMMTAIKYQEALTHQQAARAQLEAQYRQRQKKMKTQKDEWSSTYEAWGRPDSGDKPRESERYTTKAKASKRSYYEYNADGSYKREHNGHDERVPFPGDDPTPPKGNPRDNRPPENSSQKTNPPRKVKLRFTRSHGSSMDLSDLWAYLEYHGIRANVDKRLQIRDMVMANWHPTDTFRFNCTVLKDNTIMVQAPSKDGTRNIGLQMQHGESRTIFIQNFIKQLKNLKEL